MKEKPHPLTDLDAAAMQPEDVKVTVGVSQVLSVRFNADELRLLAKEASCAGLTVGALVKRAAIDAAKLKSYSRPPLVQYGFPSGGGSWYSADRTQTYFGANAAKYVSPAVSRP